MHSFSFSQVATMIIACDDLKDMITKSNRSMKCSEGMFIYFYFCIRRTPGPSLLLYFFKNGLEQTGFHRTISPNSHCYTMSSESAPLQEKRPDGSLSEEEPFSSDVDEMMYKSADEIDSVLEVIYQRVERLNERIQKTEKQVVELGRCAQSCSDRLDASIIRHMNTDQALSQLVEEDTRRTQEAQKEYDVLSNILSDGLHKSSGARMFEVLSGVSIYVGIVLSFVFMAPFHAVRTAGAKLLERLGLGAVVDMDADSQPHLSIPSLPDFIPPSRMDSTDADGIAGSGANDAGNLSVAENSRQRDGRVRPHRTEDKGITSSFTHPKSERKPRSDGNANASNSLSKSDEEFVDALDEAHSHMLHDKRHKPAKAMPPSSTHFEVALGSDVSREKRDVPGKVGAGEGDELSAKRANRHDGGNRTCRPGWAIPADDDDDMLMSSKFSSCDLLPFPSDGIKLDLLDEDPVHQES